MNMQINNGYSLLPTKNESDNSKKKASKAPLYNVYGKRVSGVFIVLFLSMCLLGTLSNAQYSILVKEQYGSSNSELKDILAFQGIEQYQVDLIGEHLKGKQIIITYDEFVEGKQKPTVNMFKTLPSFLFQAVSDTFHFKLLSRGQPDSSLISVFYPRFHSSDYVKTIEPGINYCMRFVLPGHKIAIGADRQILFSYSLPFDVKEKPGYKSYCKLTSEGIPPSKWWDEYQVKQCFVYYIQVK